ncbi:c-type cytochrome [Cytophaga aurantiaca]|uniref:c-type cytochrome n=1 Tax=Cytophaga aurantiaca TaxID=29530 RepID=UPI00037B24B0|nr:cytochrome c [Cytophaga aurantiaca]
MKHATKLKFLFFIIVFLLICILTIELFNDQMPNRFYCGVIDPPIIEQHVSEQIDFEPRHEAGEQLFKENCKSCHKIHEVSVGPALLGVTERRPRKWIYAFIKNSSALINKGDTMAVNLYNKYNKNIMTSFPSFTKAEIDSILIYIESSSRPVPIYDPPIALP